MTRTFSTVVESHPRLLRKMKKIFGSVAWFYISHTD